MNPRLLTPTTVLLSLGLFAACGGEAESERWASLARGFEPRPLTAERADWGAGLVLLPPGAGEDPDRIWVCATLTRPDWTRVDALPGVWMAARRVGNPALWITGTVAFRLGGPDGAFEYVPFDSLVTPDQMPRSSFTYFGDEVFLRLEEGLEPPDELDMAVAVDRGTSELERWRVPLGRWTAVGVPLLTGMSETVQVAVPAGSALRFSTACFAALGSADQAREAGSTGEVVFRVRAGERILFEHAQAATGAGAIERHTLALSQWAGVGELVFETEGVPAVAAFLTPDLGPLEVGDYDSRPWSDERPDILLFLADTFRADNLTAYGGTEDLTPVLDRLAEHSLVFERSRSPATWTLPSQVSMLTGLYPPQHGATVTEDAIPEAVVTLTEVLARAGYRTGAITDSGLVSRRHRFDRGFEWFDELFHDDFADTRVEIEGFLDADDGRPVFLFVQTYRVHLPYRVSESTWSRDGERLGLGARWEEVDAAIAANPDGWPSFGPVPASLEWVFDPLRALYRGGVIDLDRGVGELLAGLEQRGFLPGAYLLFTSDHGEALGEHKGIYHQGGVWEELARIPMLLSGPGIEPGRVPHPASLLDVPRTLADLAGIEPQGVWQGEPLHRLTHDRPAFVFESVPREGSAMALIADDKKLFAVADGEVLERGELLGAYDLVRDAGEQRDLRGGAEDFSQELLEALLPRAQEALRALYQAGEATIGPQAAQQLKDMGYGG